MSFVLERSVILSNGCNNAIGMTEFVNEEDLTDRVDRKIAID